MLSGFSHPAAGSGGFSSTPPTIPPSTSDDEEAPAPRTPARLNKRPLSTGATAGDETMSFADFAREVLNITRTITVPAVPASLEYKNQTWTVNAAARARSKRYPLWSLVDLYTAGDSEDVVARCGVCALNGVVTVIFIKSGVSSNGTKHYEATANWRASESRRGDYLRAALYLAKKYQGRRSDSPHGPRRLHHQVLATGGSSGASPEVFHHAGDDVVVARVC